MDFTVVFRCYGFVTHFSTKWDNWSVEFGTKSFPVQCPTRFASRKIAQRNPTGECAGVAKTSHGTEEAAGGTPTCVVLLDARGHASCPQAAVESLVLHYFAQHTDTTWQTTRCIATSTYVCTKSVRFLRRRDIDFEHPYTFQLESASSWTSEATKNKRDSDWDVRLDFTSPRCIRTERFAATTQRRVNLFSGRVVLVQCCVFVAVRSARRKLERTDGEWANTCGEMDMPCLIRVNWERLFIGATVFFPQVRPQPREDTGFLHKPAIQ